MIATHCPTGSRLPVHLTQSMLIDLARWRAAPSPSDVIGFVQCHPLIVRWLADTWDLRVEVTDPSLVRVGVTPKAPWCPVSADLDTSYWPTSVTSFHIGEPASVNPWALGAFVAVTGNNRPSTVATIDDVLPGPSHTSSSP